MYYVFYLNEFTYLLTYLLTYFLVIINFFLSGADDTGTTCDQPCTGDSSEVCCMIIERKDLLW